MAAYTRDFTFDRLSRIGDDSCSLSQKNIQNTNSANYNLTNFFVQDCGMTKPIEFATSQPAVFVGAPGTQVGLGGCNIDSNSDLLIGTINTHPKCRISLYERPFKTVPYLAKGRPQPVKESRLQQGVYVGDKKSCKNVTEKSFRTTDVDLVPSLKESIQNPDNLIEDSANKGWVRGGIPSREITRDNDYFNRKYN